MSHPLGMMWICVALVVAAIGVTIAADTPTVLALTLPCVLMMAVMVWLMSGRSHGGGNAH